MLPIAEQTNSPASIFADQETELPVSSIISAVAEALKIKQVVHQPVLCASEK